MKKLFFGILAISSACGPSNRPVGEQVFLEELDSMEVEGSAVSEDVISDVIQRIPSPLEIAVLLKESGTEYDVSILNPAGKTSIYNSNYSKALNLGVFGMDLGYTNIYQQNQDGLDYMASIKELADALNIGQFFDIETIGKLATNSRNLDSLLLITTQNFNSINHYFVEQKRSNLSVLLLTGGWIEAIHVTCQVSSKDPANTALQEKIGEQKIILEQIALLVSFYSQTDSSMKELMNDLHKLEDVFEDVEITTTYRESTMEIVDGVMVIKDNSESHVNITTENVEEIKTLTEDIRKKIINQ